MLIKVLRVRQAISAGRGMRLPLVRLVRWNCRQRSQRYGLSGRWVRLTIASASCSDG